MKSLKFTHLHEKLVNREKFRTYRILFIPTYRVLKPIKIDFEFKRELGWTENKRETLYVAKVIDIYPKRICDVSEKEAKEDGFKSKKTFEKAIMEMHKLKYNDRWGFFIVWEELNGGIEEYFK